MSEKTEEQRGAVAGRVECPVGRPVPKRATLPSDVSRCHGDGGVSPATKCHRCARREQLQHDDPTRWFPVMFSMLRLDGSCPYWIREDYQ